METFNLYVTGVGGQGIGLLSEVLLRAADHAGRRVRAVDTHGLAQRGGVVVSQIRMGPQVKTPLIPAGTAHLVAALECHEALRAAGDYLADGGCLVYYDTSWQPLGVRMGQADAVGRGEVAAWCRKRGIRHLPVLIEGLADPRMQNTAVLGTIARHGLVPEVSPEHFARAMQDLMEGAMLETNLSLFRRLAS